MKVGKAVDVRKEEVKEAKGVNIRWLISKKDGAPNFAMRLFEIDPGGFSPLHTHPYEHEVYIIEGEGVLVYEGNEHKFSKDYFIFIPPNKEHQFKNTSNTTLKFICLIPHI